jgi:hypothetical protein
MPLLDAVIATILAIFLHWLSQYFLRRTGSFVRFVMVFLLVFCGSIYWHIATQTALDDAIAALIWFTFLSELYMFLFSLSLSSLSVKMLQLLAKSARTRDALLSIYQPESMVAKRTERLQSSGLIEGEQNTFTLTPKGQRLVRFFDFIRSIFHISRNVSP